MERASAQENSTFCHAISTSFERPNNYTLLYVIIFGFFRELYAREESKDLAVKTFEEHRHFYHPIAEAQIAKDLHLA